MKFLTTASLSPDVSKEYAWVLNNDLVLEYSTGVNITVPKGFKTDLASVPQILWNIIPPFGDCTQASIVHDFLYSNKGSVCGLQFTRADADNILYTLMVQAGMSYIKAKSMYYAVRMFGGSHWS